MVRLPDAAGQLKNAPVKVLRGFFSGIGQLLLAAERFRADEARRHGVVQDDRYGQPAGPHGEAVGQMTTADFVRTSPRKFRSLDATGNVRVITPDMPAEISGENEQPPAATTPAAAAVAAADQAAATGELPVPGYDGLSVASLRARLRNLDAAQLRILLDHERSAANRPAVVTMFERRIAKLEAARDAT